ncbi:DNA-directed RNA polymerase II 16kDa polypeptide [Nosema bombycis CQ1]|uniref:DNA-directed RNA polymerase II 16kDa polypeptide n=1 Tax=Nosema bombycis (strain CQ1 / CVCC 102059) TaxID=578461 RepID=R0MII0_NOSB1|nr:DNA-directed RNA polymerase II 16kDa polypeptide [Nosema bombycis CQ1]|eukprot:EOB13960.1 DNA-directed RNA polymerase II 16kDa polypeptide [Nosema bombycis CQ1]
MSEGEELDLKDIHPVTLPEVKYLLESIKRRITLDNRAVSYRIYKQTLLYIDKFARISEKSIADDFRNSLFSLGCSEYEISVIGSLFPQSIEEAKALIPSLGNKDTNTVGKIVDLVLKYT